MHHDDSIALLHATLTAVAYDYTQAASERKLFQVECSSLLRQSASSLPSLAAQLWRSQYLGSFTKSIVQATSVAVQQTTHTICRSNPWMVLDGRGRLCLARAVCNF